MKKFVVMLLVLSLVLLTMGGCASDSGTTDTSTKKKDVTLRLAWDGSGDTKVLLDECIKKYTEKTGVKVETVFIPGTWAEYFTKIQTMIAGGESIDCAYVAIEGFRMFVDTGLAKPFTPYIEDKEDVMAEMLGDVAEELSTALSINGDIYALPVEWNNVVIHMNTKLFEEAGVTLPERGWGKDEFLEICSKLTKEVDGIKQYAITVPNYYFGAEAWLKNNGGSFMNEEFTKSRINEPESVEMFQLWQDLIYKYGYAPIPEHNVNAIQQLIDGKIAMGSWGRWPTNSYVVNEFEDVAIQYIPEFKVDQPQFGVGAMTVMSDKQYKEACDFAMWLSSSEFMTQFLKADSIPARRSVANELVPALGIPQNHEIYYKSATGAKPVSAPIQYAKCELIVKDAFSKILIEQADVQTTLDEAAKRMDEVLGK